MTTWIEALCLFSNSPPKLETLVTSVANHCRRDRFGSSVDTEALKLLDTVQRFVTQMETLFQRWYHVLAEEPNEIWCPSIQAWLKCEFLVDDNLARITPLTTAEDLDWILLASQVSAEGTEIGIIKILPPR